MEVQSFTAHDLFNWLTNKEDFLLLDVRNDVEVTSDQPDPDPDDNASSWTTRVDPEPPSLSVVKGHRVEVGPRVVFTIEVTNTGDVSLSNVAVSDVLVPDCDATVGDLAVGETTSYSCTAGSVAADFTNTAVVSGDHAAGGAVGDSDTADVDVISPAIDIQKTPDTQQILPGGDATFTITVTNTGDVALSNVVVTDAAAPDCDATFAVLAVGASETYPCTVTGVAADFTNVAVVVAVLVLTLQTDAAWLLGIGLVTVAAETTAATS